MLGALAAATPILLSEVGMLDFTLGFQLSVAISLFILFFLGVYLGKHAGSRPIMYGIATAGAGALTAIIAYILGGGQ